MSGNSEDKNVVNMAEARRRQRTDRPAGATKSPKKPASPVGKKLWGYVQVVFFLGLIFYFMQLCRGPQL
ncbi:MAG: hypothetical protein RL011_340 [Pseudomonadota bacterium]|jgi:hypothetical protein